MHDFTSLSSLLLVHSFASANLLLVPSSVFFFLIFSNFNWRLITLQYCGGFCHILTWISHGCTCAPYPKTSSHLPPHLIPLCHPSALALSALFHSSKVDWWSISKMVIYRFQHYSLKSSHRCIQPQSPKICSLYLCLFCCLAHRVIVTILLNSIYALVYGIGVFLSDFLHSV